MIHRLILTAGALVFLLGAFPLISQVRSENGTVVRTINVTGEAELQVVPDEMGMNFGIETKEKESDAARKENDRRLKGFLQLIDQLGIPRENVQTGYLLVEPRFRVREAYGDNEREQVLIGYSMNRTITITLKDLTKFEELMAQSLKLGVTSIDQVQYRTSKLRQHRDQARQMAIRAAREKAVALAAELGMKVGKPISITETPVYSGPSYYSRNQQMMQNTSNAIGNMASGSGDDSGTLVPGQISVSAKVEVTFDLE